jgi:hypothetical protein
MNTLVKNGIVVGLTGASMYALTKIGKCPSPNGIALITGISTYMITILIETKNLSLIKILQVV